MTLAQKIRLGILTAKLKMENIFTSDASYPKDPNPENWRTINGSHVHLENGKIDGGAGGKFHGKVWMGKKTTIAPHQQQGFKAHEASKKKQANIASAMSAMASAQAAQAQSTAKASMKAKANAAYSAGAKSAIEALAKHMAKKKGAVAPAPAPKTQNTDYEKKAKAIIWETEEASGVEEEYNILHKAGLNDDQAKKVLQAYSSGMKDNTGAKKASKLLAEYLSQNESAATNPAPAAPAQEPENLPFGSQPDPTPATPPAGAPKAIINKLKGTYKNASAEAKADVDYFLSTGEPHYFADDYDEPIPELCQKAYNSWKNKEITKLAAQNVVAYAITKQGSHIPQMMVEQWGDSSTPAPKPASKPKSAAAKKSATPTKTSTPYKEAAEKIMNQVDAAGSKEDKKSILSGAGLTNAEVFNVIFDYGINKSKAKETLEKILGKEGITHSPYDFSESAVGWKLPKGTQMPFKDKYGADFDAYKTKNSEACKKMTKKQAAGVWRYTVGSTHLRDWLVYGKTDNWYKDSSYDYEYKKNGWTNPYKNGMTGEALQKVCDDISAGMKKVKHPDMIVNRNCSLMDWATADNPNGLTFADLQSMAASGKTFTNKAFISATPLEKSVYGSDKARRHIFVPKKANGAFINSLSKYDNENEFLLDKNTKTRIMKVEEKNGVIYTYEEVVP